MFVPPEQFNISDHFLDDRLAEGRGDRIALRVGDRAYSYREVSELSNGFGEALRKAGVRQEERVILALSDGVEFAAALFGVLKIGAVGVMINPDLGAEDTRYFEDYSRARAAVVDAVGHHRATTLIARDVRPQPDLEKARTHRDDPALWIFSGGTTGQPKAAVQSHRSFANTAECYGRSFLGYRENDVTLSVPKLYFGYATGSNLFFPFLVGATTCLFPERSTPEVVFEQIRVHRPTLLINVPTLILKMVSHPEADRQDLSCLRLVTSAGEALPPSLYNRWKETFGVELIDGLGTAEMWHIFLSNRPGEVRPGTLGKPVPGFEVKVADEDGRELPPGEVGRMWVRGMSRAIGYWQRMEESMEVFRGPWYRSGDLMMRDQEGCFTYCGRSDDMMKVGGKWLAPVEVESCLLKHPAVKECALVGISRDGLTRPCAFVVAADPTPALAAQLQAFVLEHLEPYKHPREVILLEAMPRTHLGKIDRNALRESLQ
ncbi:MAG: benzoate-CoA ligase family protein [Armatimonadetes bacterium]|nr:benzoate-CoA ligase family protein [Armatimonadota bacterium]